jgi:cell wall-associated NlpC family hydrolase
MAVPQLPDWRERILMGVGVRPTQENLKFMDAWAKAEGGDASNNPFNTTQVVGGVHRNYNQLGGGLGVQNYVSPQQGIDATVNTLTNGRYGNIIGALRDGDDAMKSAAALAASPWGTGGLVQKILGGGGSTSPAALTDTGGSTPAPGAPAPQQPPSFQERLAFYSGQPGATEPGLVQKPPTLTGNLFDTKTLSPVAVRLTANLSDAAKKIRLAATDPAASTFGWDPANQPVTRTLTTLQTGSTQGNYRTLDLGQDFDGPVHPNANPVVNMARQYLGTPYLWGGADPRKGFDCSGFVQYLYAQAGVQLPRTTYEQVKKGQVVTDVHDLMPGDAVFFDSGGGDIHHEGLYIGGGQFIHAPHTGDVVKISSLSEPYYASQFAGGRRFIAPADSPKA